MTADEQTLRTQLAEARQEERAAGAVLQEKRARVKALEAAVASLLSPVPLGAIIAQQRKRYDGVPQGKEQRYRVERILLTGRNESEVRLMGQPVNKDGSDHARLSPTYIYGDYTVVALPPQEETAP